jgi:O-antigen ligase
MVNNIKINSNFIAAQIFTCQNIFKFMAAVLYAIIMAFEVPRNLFFLGLGGLVIFFFLFYKTYFSLSLIIFSHFVPFSIKFFGVILQISDFLIILILAVLGVKYFLGERFKSFPYPRYIIFFICAAGMSMINAQNIIASLSDVIQMIELYVFGGIIFSNTLNDRTISHTSKLLLWVVLIQVVGVPFALFEGVRYGGLLGGIFYYYAVFAGVITFHIMLYHQGKVRLWGGIAFIFICLELLATGTRSAWLGLIAGILAASFFVSLKLVRKVIVIILILLLILSLAAPDSITERIYSFGQKNFYGNVGRMYLILSAWNAFIKHPIIGVGIKNLHYQISDFLPASARFDTVENKTRIVLEVKSDAGAHNMYFEVLAELGLIGFLTLMALVLRSVKDGFQNVVSSNSVPLKMKNSCTFSSLISFWVIAMFVPGIHVRSDATLFLILILSIIYWEKDRLQANG